MSVPADETSAELHRAARRRERHWTMLTVAMIVVVFSFALQVRSDERVELRFLPGYPLPQSCLSRQWFNVNCPGCGLTRSFIYLAQGNWQRSLSQHRIGWLLAIAVLAQFPYRWFALRNNSQSTSPVWAKRFGLLLIVALLANWLFNLISSF
jgi:hypothetical protein